MGRWGGGIVVGIGKEEEKGKGFGGELGEVGKGWGGGDEGRKGNMGEGRGEVREGVRMRREREGAGGWVEEKGEGMKREI